MGAKKIYCALLEPYIFFSELNILLNIKRINSMNTSSTISEASYHQIEIIYIYKSDMFCFFY